MNNTLIQKIKNFLQIINFDRFEKFFFALFLLSIPIQTRLTFITPQTYRNGSFNEYATFFLYLSDLLLITTLFLYFVKLIIKYNNLTKNDNFSIKTYIFNLFHNYPRLIPTFTLLITLITWSFASIFWSEYKNQAFYLSFKLLEFGLSFIYIAFRASWFGLNKIIALIFITGFFESIIGITQYYIQRSLGLRISMESILSPEIPNVAKILIDGEKIIRAYGTFPHPNIFSGFLILSIFCGFYLLFLFKTKENNQIVSRETIFSKILFLSILIGYLFIGLFDHYFWTLQQGQLTFWLVLGIIAGLSFNKQIVSRETILINNSKCIKNEINLIEKLKYSMFLSFWQNKLFHVKQFVFLALNKPFIYNNFNIIINNDAKKQVNPYKIVSRETILYGFLTISILIQLFAFILTFSRIAWLSFIIIIFLNFIIFYKFSCVYPRKLLQLLHNIIQRIFIKLFHVKQFIENTLNKPKIISFVIILCIFSLFLILNRNIIINRSIDLTQNYKQSMNNRILYNNIAIKIIKKYPLLGIGNKNFTLKMQDFSNKPLEWWQFQPTHNIYLLIASELGLIGLFLFLFFVYLVIKECYLSIKK